MPNFRILAVIVLYRVAPADSTSLRTLEAARGLADARHLSMATLIYDNTPGGQNPGVLPNGVRYEADPSNSGLAKAYNRALAIAQAEGYEWLLTLDQDTSLPPSFLLDLSAAFRNLPGSHRVAAVAPRLVSGARVLSPRRLFLGVIPRPLKQNYIGVSPQETSALNSAALLNVKALSTIGGYSPLFPLDSSDHYLFRQFHKHGMEVYVAGNIEVEHNLSILDPNHCVTVSRYTGIVEAESAFFDMEMSIPAGLFHSASLVYRLYKHWKRGDRPELRAITIDILKKRLFKSKSRRIVEWRRRTEHS